MDYINVLIEEIFGFLIRPIAGVADLDVRHSVHFQSGVVSDLVFSAFTIYYGDIEAAPYVAVFF